VNVSTSRCTRCEKKEHSLDICANPEKYDQSSRVMESMGSVQTVMDIWNDCPDAYIAAIVTDEDATTRSKLSHSMSELVAAGRMNEAERQYLPEKVGILGGKRPNSGVLPLEHPYIIKHSDPIHYIKNYKGKIYVQVYLLKSKSKTCKADAMRLTRNLLYMIKQQRPGGSNVDSTFEKFQAGREASFEHHWNNQEHCGDWCQAKSWTEEEKVKKWQV
jgi:hypothetical protein